jgi:hypothetical protein
MSPQQVPAEWVDAAELALADRCNSEHKGGRDWCGCPDEGDVRLVLAAVLPLAQAAALEDLEVPLEEDYETRARNLDKRHAAYREGFLDGHEYAANVVHTAAARLREGSPS